MVEDANTIWFAVSSPKPLRSGGATGAFGVTPSTGTSEWPSICSP
jgi:hypothetical protein